VIPVKDSAELAGLIRGLSDDIVYAHVHWKMVHDLHQAFTDYPLVRQQTPTFWHLTVRAHVLATLSALCRAYDQELTALHLLGWLTTIRENLHLFSVEEFKQRLAGNAFVDSLAEGRTKPDEVQLERDITSCKSSDPLVRKLMTIRGSTHAHRSAKLSRQGRSLPAKMQLADNEVETLLARARDILNRYTQLFAAESYSTMMIGASDYQFIFETVQARVEASDAEVRAAITQTEAARNAPE
jgi:hypothetical protein